MRKVLSFMAAVLFFAGCATEEPVKYVTDEGGQLLKSFPETILLPDDFGAEGIVTGKGSTFYVSSLTTGEIYKGDYRTGEGEVFVEADNRPAVGLSYDPRSGYLFAGGATGSLYVYDGETGDLVEEYSIPGGMLVNDVIVTRDAVYGTESLAPVIYKLPLGPAGSLTSEVEIIPLSGDYEFLAVTPNPFGINSNGIEATRDGEYLIINNMANGLLYRVDPETGNTELIDIGGPLPPFGDGLLLLGKTLYIVQNFENRIVEIELSSDFLSGTITGEITDPDFEIPATVALFGNSLYAANARFEQPPGPFYVVKVSR